MKSLIFVLGLVIAAGPHDKAIAACQWILDVGSPFRKCMNAFDVGRVKEFYSMCLDIFCDKGEKGVCEFAANLGDICDEKYDITINGGPDFCAPVPTTPESYCTDVPGKDENAIEACDWLLDVHSPFRKLHLLVAMVLQAKLVPGSLTSGRHST
ncbi:hypothetical protein LSH36_453g02046 [Paralvinella palmiformis]|uniref:Extracellular membrane protein CFEM domain-containing protein n=1 Tax=Paralvinella palmiformis TaxID=53620 RepID=A0AAD9JB07_9ANNE|nr:hypothetical protein LSH36_453g02046 [Paralvinella palmiformis]